MVLPTSHLRKKIRGQITALATVIAFAAFAPAAAYAQCANPAGVAGDVTHNTDYNVPTYCDGTNWVGMVGANPNESGDAITGLSIRSSIAPDTTNLWKVEHTEVVGNYAFVSAYTNDHIAAIDISDPDNPVIEAVKATGLNVVQRFDIVGNILYALSDRTLVTVDISDPTNMTIMDTGPSPGGGQSNTVQVFNNYAYSISGSGTEVWNVSDPYNISYVKAITGGAMIGTENLIHNGVYYVIDGVELCSFDLVDPENPSLLNCFQDGIDTSMTTPRDMFAQDDYLYYLDKDEDKLVIVDVSDPSTDLYHVAELANVSGELDTPEGVFVDGDYAFVTAEGSDSVSVIDVSDPSTPRFIASVSDPVALNAVDNVFVRDNLIYAGNSASGFAIIDILRGQGTITEIVPDGLVGHWRLDETSGTVAYDSSGILNNGNILGGVTLPTDSVAAPTSRGLTFDGTATSIVELPLNSAYDFTGPHAVSFWAKWNGGTSTSRRIFSRQLSGTNFWALRYRGTDDSFQTIYNVGGTGFITSAGVGFGDGNWHHVAMVLDASYNLILYLDGVAIHTKSGLSAPDFSSLATEELSFGGFRSGSPTENFIGELDDFRIYNNELTPAEIAELYNARDGIRYNPSHRKMEYFDQNKWVSMTLDWPEVDKGPIYSTTTVAGCPNIGDSCSDGSLYAGDAPDTGERFFVTDVNQGTNVQWNSATGNDDMGTVSDDNGSINHANVNVAYTSLPAINACETLSLHGYDDWYLPAPNELTEIYTNSAAIDANATDAINNAGGYWTSREVNDNNANRVDNSGVIQTNSKTQDYGVRCVRRSPQYVSGTGGLIGHWKLDETEGTTATDSSGNGNDGTLNGGMDATNDSIPGPVGTALLFDGIDDYITIANESVFDNGPFTLALWYTTDRLDVSNQVLISKHDDSLNDGYRIIRNGTGNQLAYRLEGVSDGYRVLDTTTLNDDGWQHVVLVYDGSAFSEVYTNGVKDDSNDTPHTGTLSETNLPLQIGGSTSDGTYWAGAIDDVRFYDRVLSDAEITALYQMGTPVGSSTALPQGCPNIGDICDDGTVYAGLSPDGSVEMFTTVNDAGEIEWNDGVSGNWTATGATSATDGDGNTNTIVVTDSNTDAGFQPHNAAQYCYDLVAGGADDWYLPAQDELNVLYTNRVAIGNFELAGGEYGPPVPSWYFSSTEIGSADIRLQRFEDGTVPNAWNKHYAKSVRCVRKGQAPRCANPYGMEGDLMYNTTHDVMQYCDGARWLAIGKVN